MGMQVSCGMDTKISPEEIIRGLKGISGENIS
jgi:hypothetical protein